MKKICFVSSCGGHLMELLQLYPVSIGYKAYLVSEYNDSQKDIVRGYQNHYFLLQQERRNLRFIYVFLYNIVKSLYIILKERPNYIITTGAGSVFPTCIFGKLFCAKVIYIESFAKINSKSFTGNLLYKIADRFYVQWEEMLLIYPNALYYGAVY